MIVVPLDARRALPQRVPVRVGTTQLDVVVLATPAALAALRAAPADLVPARLPAPADGSPTGPLRDELDADLLGAVVVVRSGGRISCAHPLRTGARIPVVVDGALLADLEVTAADLPVGALTGSSPVGDALRLTLHPVGPGRVSLAPPRASDGTEGPFDALA